MVVQSKEIMASGIVGDTATETSKQQVYPRLFNKIVLTLENSLISEDKLENSPSRIDGLDKETEKDLRILGCELIQTAGILLKLPQVAMATGQVLFQRFYYCKSFVRHNMETTAMSCVCLASKIEEAPRRIRDVINVFNHIKQVRTQREIIPIILDQAYTNLKNLVIKAERRVLKELGFCVHIKHPHKLIVMYLQVLGYEKNEKLMQISWNFMNDSLRTDVFMRYQPETIACACIYLTARKLGLPLPSSPHWFGLFKVSEEHIIDICFRVMELYKRTKPNVEKLEESVEELKKLYMESRTKRQEISTPPAVTTVDRNNGSHNAWGGFIQRTLPLPDTTKAVGGNGERSPRDHKMSPSKKRSHSRSISRSRSRSRSHSPTDEYKSRSSKKSRNNRSRSPNNHRSMKNKKSRHYSRSHSRSHSPQNKHRKSRKTSRERSDYYSSNGGDRDRKERGDHKYRNDRIDDRRNKHDRYNSSRDSKYQHHRNSGGSGSGKHRERSRDYKR